jgi:hypothetical protein
MVKILKYVAEFSKSYGCEKVQMLNGKNSELGHRQLEITELFLQDSSRYNFIKTCPTVLESK